MPARPTLLGLGQNGELLPKLLRVWPNVRVAMEPALERGSEIPKIAAPRRPWCVARSIGHEGVDGSSGHVVAGRWVESIAQRERERKVIRLGSHRRRIGHA